LSIEKKDINSDPLVEIFSGSLWESEVIKSLLDDAGINSFLKNNVLRSYLFIPAKEGEVKVMILNSDFTEAKKIVDDYLRNINADLS
jgi:hypothetical protein